MTAILLSCLIGIMPLEDISVHEPVIGGPCEGCELVFSGMPDELTSHTKIMQAGNKDKALVIEGVVLSLDGIPAEGIIVYIYHTNTNGIYPKSSTRHGGLRGWAVTDQNGHYRFDTIRPGAYPGRGNPQHVHMHVIEPGRFTYYIDDITFDDDPLLTNKHREKNICRGGCGESRPMRNQSGAWHVYRDIVLGQAIPEYK